MAEESVTDEAREKGVEEVECPNCGAKLTSHEEADGAISFGPCTSCYSAADSADVEKAAAENVNASPSRELGTNTEEE